MSLKVTLKNYWPTVEQSIIGFSSGVKMPEHLDNILMLYVNGAHDLLMGKPLVTGKIHINGEATIESDNTDDDSRSFALLASRNFARVVGKFEPGAKHLDMSQAIEDYLAIMAENDNVIDLSIAGNFVFSQKLAEFGVEPVANRDILAANNELSL